MIVAVVVGHCSSASHKEWLPLIEALKADWRVLAPDLIGYGSSAPWPADKPFKAEADLDVLTAVAKKSRGALHFVGHSYGAALALETARRLGDRVKSLPLVISCAKREGRSGTRSSSSARLCSAASPTAMTARQRQPS